MNPQESLNQKKAIMQWQILKSTIEKAGAEVVVMEPAVSFFSLKINTKIILSL